MKTIAIDAGHGMGSRTAGVFDPGAVGVSGTRTLYEAHIALHYTLTLKYVLSRAGYRVFLTRADNTTDAPLRERVSRAIEQGCHAFLSIHLNSSDPPPGSGIETLYRTETQRKFAESIHHATRHAFPTLPDRGLKHRTKLAVLKFEPYACLLELGFINNPNDMAVVCPADHRTYREARRRWAESVANALKEALP